MLDSTTRLKFTDSWVAEVPLPVGKRKAYYDTVSTSLVLIVTPKGGKTFYRAGRPSRILIGRPSQGWTVELARQRCNSIVGDLAKGKNPIALRQRKRASKTLGQMWGWYLENYAKKEKRTWKQDINTWNNGLVEWADRKLSEITRADFIERLNMLIKKHGPNHARHQMSLLNSIYKQARRNRWVRRRPGRGVPLPQVKARKRHLTKDELPIFFGVLTDKKNAFSQLFQDFVTTALFTGARRINVQAMEYSEIVNGLWTIPAAKAKEAEPIRIPLPPEVVKIITRRMANSARDSRFVFASDSSETGHVAFPSTVWKRFIDLTQLPDFRFHDLRHTFATYQVSEGFSLEIIGAGLGHRDRDSTVIYTEVMIEPIRESIAKGVAAIKKASRQKKSKKSPK